jgi:hypothetical protein
LEPAPWKSVLIKGSQYRYPLVTLFLTATAASEPGEFPPKFISNTLPLYGAAIQIGFN